MAHLNICWYKQMYWLRGMLHFLRDVFGKIHFKKRITTVHETAIWGIVLPINQSMALDILCFKYLARPISTTGHDLFTRNSVNSDQAPIFASTLFLTLLIRGIFAMKRPLVYTHHVANLNVINSLLIAFKSYVCIHSCCQNNHINPTTAAY